MKKKKYRVSATVVGGKYIGDFESVSEETLLKWLEAGNGEENFVSLCHQCSGECENPEIVEYHIEEVT
jgi:hypothetical protein